MKAINRQQLRELTGHDTLKAARNDSRYIKSFMTHGNAKLMDYIPAKHGERSAEQVALIPGDSPPPLIIAGIYQNFMEVLKC